MKLMGVLPWPGAKAGVRTRNKLVSSGRIKLAIPASVRSQRMV
jgi:hypothetical protein